MPHSSSPDALIAFDRPMPPDPPELIRAHADDRPLLLPGGKVDPEAIRRLAEASGEGEDDAELRRVTFTIQRADLNTRLDKYLTSRITFMSRNQLQRLIDGGGVLVNRRTPKASTRVGPGDVIEVVVPAPPQRGTQPEDIALSVLHEDEHLIVLNKSPDIIVHPARSELSGTLINALAHHFRHRSPSGGALSSVGEDFARPGVVHRLDRHTSGCIVFAKQDEAHWKLGHQFEHRKVEKRYLAVVEGHVRPDADLIELPIGPHPSREKGYREKYVVRHDEKGKHAVTLWRVLERYGPAPPTGRSGKAAERRSGASRPGASVLGASYSLLELELRTGRTHQIRVHLSHLGWPIVGDDMYGGRPYIGPGSGETVIARQALHAAYLAFTHPVTGAAMVFTAPVPPDMALLVRRLREANHVEPVAAEGTLVNAGLAFGKEGPCDAR